MRLLNVITLWICVYLFCARVLGQIYIGIYSNVGMLHYLPAWEFWYSGLLPYPLLLISQILIIQLMTLMAYDFSRKSGFFFVKSSKIQKIIRYFSILYFSSMLIRGLWFKDPHMIPIVFHCVLATFLFVYSFSVPDNKQE